MSPREYRTHSTTLYSQVKLPEVVNRSSEEKANHIDCVYYSATTRLFIFQIMASRREKCACSIYLGKLCVPEMDHHHHVLLQM